MDSIQRAARPRRSLAALRALTDVLSNPQLRRLQVAWAGCITAEWAQIVALGVYAFSEQGAIGVGIVGLVRTLPAAIIGPFAASLADRYRREVVLRTVLTLRAVTLAGAAVALSVAAPTILVYGLAAADAMVYTLFWPAQSALLPSLAQSPEELTACNITSTTVENLGTLIGPTLSGVLLLFAGVPSVFAAAAMLLAMSAVVVARIQTDGAPNSLGQRHQAIAELLAGFRTLARERRPRLVVLLYLAQTFCLGALTVLIVVMAIELLGLGEAGVGYLNAAVGAGGLVGALATVALVGRRQLALPFQVGLIAWGIALAAIGALPSRVTAVAMVAIVGSANALIDVTALTLLQRIVAQHVLARVLGVFEGLWWGMQGLGAMAASLVVTQWGVRASLVATGTLLAIAAVLAGRALARIDDDAHPPQPQLELLRGVPLFASLPVLVLERLAFTVQPVTARDTETLVRRGDEGDHFYVIVHGQVEVTAPQLVRTLGPGDFFGEIALLRSVPRTATVTAKTEVELLALERQQFISAVVGHAPSAAAAEAVVVARLD
ncbi:MAG: MFS transporter [Actinomycetota bacterium]|nr:MFS transporter [Actinomycetota bacterium]